MNNRGAHSISRSRSKCPIQIDQSGSTRTDRKKRLTSSPRGNGESQNGESQNGDQRREESDEGLISSDHTEQDTVPDRRKGRKRSLTPTRYPIPLPPPCRRRHHSQSGDHNRRSTHHGRKEGEAGRRHFTKGKKRFRSPSPSDFDDDYEDYDDNDRYYDQDYERDYERDYEDEFDNEYGEDNGDDTDAEFEHFLRARRRRRAKGKALPRRDPKQSSRKVPDWQPPVTGMTSDEGEGQKDDWDKLQEKLVAERELTVNENQRKKQRKERSSTVRSQATTPPPVRRTTPSSTLSVAPSTPLIPLEQVGTRPGDEHCTTALDPCYRPVTNANTETDDPVSITSGTACNRAIKLAQDTFDQAKEKGPEVTEKYAHIVDDALR